MWGLPVLDADQVARGLTAPGGAAHRAVIEAFPHAVGADGSLDRTALRRHIASDQAARRRLEALTHPLIRNAIVVWLEAQREQGHRVAVVEAALIVEAGQRAAYDALLVVAVSPDVQRARLQARDGTDDATAAGLIAAQAPQAAKIAVATTVWWNDGDLEALHAKVDAWARPFATSGAAT